MDDLMAMIIGEDIPEVIETKKVACYLLLLPKGGAPITIMTF